MEETIWYKDINQVEYELIDDFGGEVELREYPSGFKIKIPKIELGKSFIQIKNKKK